MRTCQRTNICLRARSRAFTLIELLVSIAIIALLITLVTVGVSKVHGTAKGAAERQTVVGLNQAVQAFKQEFGFLPPFVSHNDASPTIRPVEKPNPTALAINSYGGTIASTAQSYNGNVGFLEGFSNGDPRFSGVKPMSSDWAAGTIGATNTTPDWRFSEHSLAYFLVGALGQAIDGVEGPGMFKPRQDGTFEFASASVSNRVSDVSGRTYPALVDTSRQSPKLVNDLETSKSKDSNLSWTDPDTGKTITGVNTRMRLIAPNGKPYRYYRWAPRARVTQTGLTYYNTLTNAFDRVEDGVDRLNVPSLLGDPREDTALRGAEYAIVSAGPDAYFGDMNLEASTADGLSAMAGKVRVALDSADISRSSMAVRKAARADNIVEVGR